MKQTCSANAMLKGSIAQQMLLFFLPIWFGTFFQQLYNTADALIVGNFVGTKALAAVGATGSFVQLLVGFFVGLCSGASVVISQSYGADQLELVSRQVHTALALALLGGAVLTVLGLLTARAAVVAMGTPADILDQAVLYLRIYFLGMIPQMIYNMGASILRAVGDSKRPLYFLMLASVLNIVLDLILVPIFHLGVAGTAIATVLSQTASALLTLRCLAGENVPWTLRRSRITLDKEILKSICRIGLPAALQSSLYSVSNILIQSGINGFGTIAVAAWSVYGKIDFLFWMTISSLGISVTTFAGQNFGAGLYRRVKKGTLVALGLAVGITLAISGVLYPSSALLFRLFSHDTAVVEQGVQMMHFLVPVYMTYICIEIFSGTLRGCGDVAVPTAITCFGVCGLRIVWLVAALPLWHTVEAVEFSYPISWVLSSLLFVLYYWKGGWLKRRIAAREAAAAAKEEPQT
ncbi:MULTISPECIES: MATE family efflux transporter [Caproicibacterium]|uniref:MATE family efflux transporter n=1 Tax=Caproicibacterium argilliputei TaxID=3030016 RepID=A0AA97H1D3_9FIRM|nr:MATE family efflux transporter [Caproicibacterium argilliputei]WOC31545.1 MATE family efflux transporter [Caproicibacterium argilliputei]